MTHLKRIRWIVLAGLLACCASTSAGAAVTTLNLRHDNPDGIRKLLLKSGDADSLAAASLMDYPRGPAYEERLAYAAEAARLAPGRADLAWLHYAMCASGPSCDGEPLVAHLRLVDPGNRAALGIAVHEAVLKGDGPGVTSALEAMGAPAGADSMDPPAFRTYWNPLVQHLAGALIRTHRSTEQLITLAVVDTISSLELLAYSDLARACQGATLLDADRLQACRSVVPVLRNSDTYIVEAVGLAIVERAWPAADPFASEASRRGRTLAYQMSLVEENSSRELGSDNGSLHLLKRLAAHDREQDSGIAQLVELHRPVDPPDDWKGPQSR